MKNIMVIFMILFSLTSQGQEALQIVSGCQEADYVLADQQSSVAFQGASYTPKCLKILVGSEVTISASKKHPLSSQGQAQNPIANTESTQTYTFNDTGVFGYFCDKHGDANGNGMAGAVWVVENL